MYPCQKCSACCRLVGRVVLGERMADADGVCHFLDRTTNLCTQYENRPIFCNVDKFYERYYVDNMTREVFYKINQQECERLRKLLGV